MGVIMGLDATVQFRTSSSVKEGAFAVFEEMGISPSTALQLFLQQVQKTKTLPFSVTAYLSFEDKEEGYDEWLSARLDRAIKMLDSGEMESSPIEEVEARMSAKRDAYKKQLKTE
jgi:addiction module RelB/DinJ family antitoxin